MKKTEVDRATVKAIVEQATGRRFKDGDLDGHINDHDFDATTKKHEDRLEVEVWDRVSPINGATAEEVLAGRHDVPDEGDIYLVKVDGTVVYFQPHDPYEEGHVKLKGTHGRGQIKKLEKSLVDNYVTNDVIQDVLKKLEAQ